MLFDCCACTRWAAFVAERLADCADDAEIFALSEAVWWKLSPGDWREAIDVYPSLGEHPLLGAAGPALREELAAAIRSYEERFGMPFVGARGRDAAELLLQVRRRLGNAPDVELRVSATEQAELTRQRLGDVLAHAVAA